MSLEGIIAEKAYKYAVCKAKSLHEFVGKMPVKEGIQSLFRLSDKFFLSDKKIYRYDYSYYKVPEYRHT